jgi:hypothetical protein
MHSVRQITVALASLSRAPNECHGRTPAFSCLWRAYWPRAPKLPCRPARIARRVPSHAPIPCSHAPMHPCTRAARAIRQQPSSPAPEHSPSPRPLMDSLSIVDHPASFNDQLSNIPYPSSSQPHPSRVQPRCRQPACHWPSCRFVRVSGAQRQRALMCASLPARATASLQRSPQASPYHRPSPISRHSLVTRCAPRPQEPTTLHAAPSPLCPQTQNTTKHPRALLDSPPQLHQHSQKAPLPYRPSTRPTAYLPHDPRSPILARPARPLLALPCRDATPAARPPPRRRPTPARFLASSCNPLTCP